MKIAVFHNLPLGGAKRVVDEQIKTLSHKHEVKVFNIDFSFQGNRLKRDFDNFFTLAQKHKKLAWRIDKENFEFVLVHPDKLTQAPFILRYLKTPTLYYCEELLRIAYEKELKFCKKVFFGKKIYEQVTRALRKKIDRDNARCANIILTNSKHIQKRIKKAYGKKSVVCYPGVDTEKFKSQNSTVPAGRQEVKKKNQLLFIGKPSKINGYPLANQISKLANIPLKVIQGHKLSDRKLVEEYSKSIATLCLSYNEPFGLVPLESMACGTLVLAVNEGGYKETIINNKTGFLFKRDPKKFAEKIIYLIKHPKIIEKMGKTARQHVIKNFNWKKHNRFLEHELEQLIK